MNNDRRLAMTSPSSSTIFASQALAQLDDMAAFREMGGRTVVVGGQRPEAERGEAVTVLPYDPDEDWAVPALRQAPVAVLYGQIAGLFAAQRRGVNIYEPSAQQALYDRTGWRGRLYDSPNDLYWRPESPSSHFTRTC